MRCASRPLRIASLTFSRAMSSSTVSLPFRLPTVRSVRELDVGSQYQKRLPELSGIPLHWRVGHTTICLSATFKTSRPSRRLSPPQPRETQHRSVGNSELVPGSTITLSDRHTAL